MTTYNFDTIINRRGNNTMKWDMYPDALPMWVADMDFQSPPQVIEALTERVAHGVFGYQYNSPQLRTLICERMARLYNWEVTPEQILFLPGLVPGLFLTSRIFGDMSSGVLMQTPVYPPFLMAARHFKRPLFTTDLVQTDQPDGTIRYEIDFDAFEAAITPQTKVFFLCNPHNPVGRAYTREELARIAELCVKHDLLIVSDEIHCDLLMAGIRHTPIASLAPEISARTITLMAPSKTFNLAGLGCSFAIIQDETLRTQVTQESHGPLPGVNILGFTAAEAAYQHGGEWLEALLGYLQTNRDIVVDFVQENLPGIKITRPEATFLSWLDCRALNLPENNAYQYFLDHAKVAMNDGKSFGEAGVGFVRLNFGTPRATLMDGLERLRSTFTKV